MNKNRDEKFIFPSTLIWIWNVKHIESRAYNFDAESKKAKTFSAMKQGSPHVKLQYL